MSLLSSYLSCDTVVLMNRIKFASDILTDSVINKGEQRFRYKLVWCNNKWSFDILNDISDHIIHLVILITLLVSQYFGFMIKMIKYPLF